eukprot:SAG11_NODE_19118_length_473_cov_14.382353_1_plen_75_part_10
MLVVVWFCGLSCTGPEHVGGRESQPTISCSRCPFPYRVRWTARDETWEPRENLLPGAKRMLKTYDEGHGIVDGRG